MFIVVLPVIVLVQPVRILVAKTVYVPDAVNVPKLIPVPVPDTALPTAVVPL
jgi:hypothetical protein